MGKQISMAHQKDDMAMCVALDSLAEIVAVGYHSGFIRMYLVLTGNFFTQ